VAILLQYLAAAGNIIGRGPHYRVEGDRHGPNIFGVLVGETAKGRKGTSWGRVRQIMEIADPPWAQDRVHSGLSTGEGVIWAVRDSIMARERVGRGKNRQTVAYEADPGVADKRIYLIEPEFAGALTVMGRHGNILSRVIRDAWDRGNLATDQELASPRYRRTCLAGWTHYDRRAPRYPRPGVDWPTASQTGSCGRWFGALASRRSAGHSTKRGCWTSAAAPAPRSRPRAASSASR
jgi:hypothetical protein